MLHGKISWISFLKNIKISCEELDLMIIMGQETLFFQRLFMIKSGRFRIIVSKNVNIVLRSQNHVCNSIKHWKSCKKTGDSLIFALLLTKICCRRKIN